MYCELCKIEIKKRFSFLAVKNNKISSNKFSQRGKSRYKGNYKTFMTDIENDTA